MGAVTAALAIGAAASMMQASQESDALNRQADYSERMSRVNKRLSDMQAEDTLDRGNTQARNVEKQGKQILGSQRANFAAQGIALDSGSAQDIQTETSEMTALDALTVRNNAAREAWGIRFQGAQGVANANLQASGMRNQAGSTLLTGGLRAAAGVADAYGRSGGSGSGNRYSAADRAYDDNRMRD